MDGLSPDGTRDHALADALSRHNALSGLYKKLELPLEWKDLSKKDPILITHAVNLADKAIQDAIDNGKDLNDLKTQDEVRAAFFGGIAGTSLAIVSHKFLRLLGFRK